MNEEMDKQFDEQYPVRYRKFRIVPALLLIGAGVIWCLKRSGAIELPNWLADWTTLLIAFGILGGLKHRFRPGFWIIPIVIGVIGMMRFFYPGFHFGNFIAPAVLIAVGLLILIKPNGPGWRQRRMMMARHHRKRWEEKMGGLGEFPDAGDELDVTAVFGGVKKKVLSKKFRGADITCFFGGCEIDLRQADFEGEVLIDTTNIMGGTKLIVPANWNVQSDVTCVLGGVDDKRDQVAHVDQHKKLRIDGTCVMGGIEIRSY